MASETIAPKMKPKMNGSKTATYILSGVAVVILASTILGAATHLMRHDVHQERQEKYDQTFVWFSQWWDQKFQRDIKPEFDELKQMIRGQRAPTKDKDD